MGFPLSVVILKTNFFILEVGAFFYMGDFNWEGGRNLPENNSNLPRTYEKLHFREEPYQFRD